MASIFSSVSMAQEIDQSIDIITVSGVRTPIGVDAISNAITIVDAGQIAAQQITHFADILRQIPGVSVSLSGAVGSVAEVRIRGTEANHVLVLIDGIEANDPANSDAFLFENLMMQNIERIEIIRGPQSALWGSDAIGGVINIVTGTLHKETSINAYIEGGSFGTISGGGNIQFYKEKWDMMIGASHFNTVGTNTSRIGTEKDGYENTTFNTKIKAQLKDNFSLTVSARHMTSLNDFDAIDFLATGLPTDGDYVSNVSRTYLGSNAHWLLFDGRWEQRASVNWMDSKNKNYVTDVMDGATNADRLKASYQSTFFIDKDHAITAAVDYEKTKYQQMGIAQVWGDPNQTQTISNTGYLLDYVGKVIAPLTITASLRFDENSDFDNIKTWRIGGNYHLKDINTHIKFSMGRGQKAPSFIDRFGYFPDLFIGQRGLKPEHSKGYEFGVVQTLWDTRINVEVTYFNNRLSDEIDGFVFDSISSLYTAKNKVGKSTQEGIEFVFDVTISQAWSLFANYTFTNAIEPNGLGGFQRELRRPRHVASMGLSYKTKKDAGFTITSNYVGQHMDIFFPPWPDPSEIVTLDDYILVRMAASYPVGNGFSLYARVENAFNVIYEDVYGFTTPKRGLYAGLRFKF